MEKAPVKVLVDTPVWSLALRRNVEQLSREQVRDRETLSELIGEGRAEIIGPVRQEVLSGIRNQQQFQKVLKYLRLFDDTALRQEDYEEAARIHNLCRAAGISGSGVDFLICAAAQRRQWQILTLDRDFERYARHTSIRLLMPKSSAP